MDCTGLLSMNSLQDSLCEFPPDLPRLKVILANRAATPSHSASKKRQKKGGGDGGVVEHFGLIRGSWGGFTVLARGGWVRVEACASLPAMTNAELQKKLSIECNDCSLRPYSTLTICFCCCKTTSCYCWIPKLPYTDTILAHLANYVVV